MATQVSSETLPRLSVAPARSRSFGSGARVLSIGIASTGLFTFAYLATASHVLNKAAYSRVALCWSIMFVITSVIYRPIEQLLSRTIADREARGESAAAVLRTPALIQVAFAATFLIVALLLREPIVNGPFDGSTGLYWVLVIGVLAYSASYFARGWLAGHRRFALYGSLVFLESTSRLLFAVAAAIGITHGQNAVAAGMAVAPFVSLCVIPFAFRRVRGDTVAIALSESEEPTGASLSLRHGSRFAGSVLAIMLSEQTLMNAGVIVVAANSHFDLTSGLAGFVFNVLLIVRAPLQLFQAVQTSILPHLTAMYARNSDAEFRRTVRRTTRLTLGFGAIVALGLLVVGPLVMRIAVGDHGFTYERWGLAAVGLGMGFHLTAGTLNQALLARGRATVAASIWLCAAIAFVLFVALPTIANEVTRTEVGYCGATCLLMVALGAVYRSPSPASVGTSRRIHLPLRRPTRTGGIYAWIAAVALYLALVSMISDATPSYDPWSWLIWGREILHGSLSTYDGPTWKPLPVLFTTVFAVFGHLQPNLWLIVSRWGFFVAVFMSFRIAARLVARIQDQVVDGPARYAAPVLAGLVAAVGIGLAGELASDSAIGYSEGLAVAFMLITFDRAYDGHHRQAFLAGMVVAWDRPESWIVWGPYGLWLMWKDPGARALVVGVAVLTLLVWFVPQKLGGGSFSSGVARAHNPRSNSAAFSSFPFWTELHGHGWHSVFRRARLIAVLGIFASVVVTGRSRMRTRRPNQGVLLIALLGLTGIAWWVLISIETQAGFSGNDRYLIFGSALVYICTGASVGWAAVAIAQFINRRRGGPWLKVRPAQAILAVTLTVALAYAFLPSGWIGTDLVQIPALRYHLHYQARLRIGFQTLIQRAGGYAAVNACGTGNVQAENFQVPMAAWYLHREIHQVDALPGLNAAGEAPVRRDHWPSTIFQDRSSPNAALEPRPSTIAGWEHEGAHYVVTRMPDVTMYQDCST
jgi:O-antigen/teichoic acid export membrane protein